MALGVPHRPRRKRDPAVTPSTSPAAPTAYPLLLSPITIGSLTMRNRVVMGSMHTGLEDGARHLPELAAYFAARARGGVGLIVTGGYAPNKRGWLKPLASELTTRLQAMRHRDVTGAVHDEGGAIALQVLHAGRYAYHPLSVSASARKSPITPFKPSALSTRGVDRTATDFARSVALAVKAGYDAVEIMGSEGYLINQFLAQRTNDRSDAWGGSAEKRRRFPLEIVRRSRELVGADFPIVYRISLLDLVEGGQTWEEVEDLAHGARGRRRQRAQHRHRLARGAGADDHHPGAARRLAPGDRPAQGRGLGAGLRVQPDQHPRAGRGDPRRRRGRPDLDGAPAARRPRVRREGRGRPVRRDQHLHRLQPGLPRPRLPQPARLLPGQPARLPRDHAGARAPPSAPPPSRWSAPGPPVSPPPCRRPSAASRSPCSSRTDARRAVPAGHGRARQGGLRRDAALLRRVGSRCSASTCGSAPRPPRPTSRRTTRWWSPPA